jgi:UDP-2-acetamido-2-deoxy-ribo-hexuluronate aminotransferase
MEFCNLKAQYEEYRTELDAAMGEVLRTAAYVGGPAVGELEKELTAFTGSNAIACANGTDALYLALMAAGVKPGDEVITTPFTFIATAEMVALYGAVAKFADIRDADFNMDPAKLEQAITARTTAVLPVSLYGQPADMDALAAVVEAAAKKYGHPIALIEDAAQSFGAMYKGKRSCNLSPIASTSFFPAKPLGCYGDGGAVFARDPEVADRLRCLRNHGMKERYRHHVVGMNSRLDTIQAAVLRVKLKHYEVELVRRQAIADRYTALLAPLVAAGKLSTPQVLAGNASVWAQYTIRLAAGPLGSSIATRDAVQKALQAKGIPTAVHYPMPLHLQECFASLGGKVGDFPVSERAANEVMSVPMSAHITEAEQVEVVAALTAALA